MINKLIGVMIGFWLYPVSGRELHYQASWGDRQSSQWWRLSPRCIGLPTYPKMRQKETDVLSCNNYHPEKHYSDAVSDIPSGSI